MVHFMSHRLKHCDNLRNVHFVDSGDERVVRSQVWMSVLWDVQIANGESGVPADYLYTQATIGCGRLYPYLPRGLGFIFYIVRCYPVEFTHLA